MTDEGAARRQRAQGRMHEKLFADSVDLDPGLAEWTDSFVFGDVWGRPGMAHEERMLVAISSLATNGHLPQLRNYLHGAVQDGISARKLQETLAMLTVYAGFPVAINALAVWREVVAASRRAGIALDLDS